MNTIINNASPADINRLMQAQQLQLQGQYGQLAAGQAPPRMSTPPQPPYIPPFDPKLIPVTETKYWTVVDDAAVNYGEVRVHVESVTITLGDATVRPTTMRSIPALLFATEAEARGYCKQLVRERFRVDINKLVEQLTMAGLKDGLAEDPETDLAKALHHYLQEIAS